MNIPTDIIGQKFGKLTVINIDYELSNKKRKPYYICQCDCNNIKSICRYGLLNGASKSCGCLHMEAITKKNKLFVYPDYNIVVGFLSPSSDGEIKFYILDLEDLDIIKDIYWCETHDGYLRGVDHETHKKVNIHRKIMSKYYDLTDKIIDHINHNKFDNRKCNLRVCGYSENNLNRSYPGSNTGYPNIYYHSEDNLYQFAKQINGVAYTKSFINKENVIKYSEEFNNNVINTFFYNKDNDTRFNNTRPFILGGVNNSLNPIAIIFYNDYIEKIKHPFNPFVNVIQI